MKNLLYLFLLSILMVGCHNQSEHYLDKAKTMLGVSYDSLLFYLQKIDSASLDSDQLCEYYCLKLPYYSFMMSLGNDKADSISNVLVEHFKPEDKLAFRARTVRANYYLFRSEYRHSDSVINLAKALMKSRKDSLFWFNQKSILKHRMGEKDSSLYYVEQLLKYNLTEKQLAYSRMGELYVDMGLPDSAMACYKKALTFEDKRMDFYYYDRLIELLQRQGKYKEGLDFMLDLRKQMKRSDIPYVNFVQGELWLELHRPDSAMKYYRIASETGNSFIAVKAFSRMGNIMEGKHSVEGAFHMYNKSHRNLNDIHGKVEALENMAAFDALKLKNQLNELEMARQQHVIVILGMTLFIAVLIGGFILYIFYRRRMTESKQLLQENILLRQQEELSALREKEALLREQDARMREELFKRMKVFDKISLADKEHLDDNKDNCRINLSDNDWIEIRLMLDSTYHNFTRKLKQDFPELSERDINFCCLVKINVGLQSLSDIYCISKNSVSRRKLRMKEKMRIEEGITLDDFLRNY